MPLVGGPRLEGKTETVPKTPAASNSSGSEYDCSRFPSKFRASMVIGMGAPTKVLASIGLKANTPNSSSAMNRSFAAEPRGFGDQIPKAGANGRD